MACKTILAIDGGGIRGLIPALLLAALEQRTGKPTARLFDMMAGTSTGGILALGLAMTRDGKAPLYSAMQMAELYQQHGTAIFPSDWLRSLCSITNERYPHRPLEKILQQYFGDATLHDTLSEVLVTAYDIERRAPVFFKRHKAVEEAARNYFLRDIARATSAAPTYFEPARVQNVAGSTTAHLIDGGVFANNPAACAVAEHARLCGEREDVLILSLGTGELVKPIPFARARTWGKVGWLRPVLDVMFDGVSDTVDYQLSYDYPPRSGRRRYYRLQCVLDEGFDAMDNASAANIERLQHKATDLLRRNDQLLDELAEALAGR